MFLLRMVAWRMCPLRHLEQVLRSSISDICPGAKVLEVKVFAVSGLGVHS